MSAPGWAGWADWTDVHRGRIRDAGQWRRPRTLADGHPATTVVETGADVVAFASNDYLGLSQHPAVIAAATAALARWGTGSGASRLVVGSRPVHDELEAALAAWKGAEAAVVFPTGFAANLGVLTTFGHRGALVCSDELNHASIIDGCRLARAELAVYPHGDLEALDHLLAGAASAGRPALVATDVVFSMDGDVVDLEVLVELVERHGALAVLDEAHVVFPDSAARRVEGHPAVLRVGTLSKTLGSLGGFVAGTRAACELLVNRARSYIFTTAPTPADCAAALAAVGVVRSAEGADLVVHLRELVDVLRPGHPSAVLPVVVGAEDDAVALSDALAARGLLVPAIRPPTVPAGTSRLRVALSAAHTRAQVEALAAALGELGATP